MVDKSRPRKLRSCLVGCGALVAVAVLLAVVTVAVTFRGYREAVGTRERLERAYPTQLDFTPAADGTIAPERLERFIAVRAALAPFCERVTRDQTAFARMAARGEGNDGADAGIFGDLWRALRATPRLGRDFGSYINARNDALLEAEMGLGEYTWIYVVVYFGELGYRPARFLGSRQRPTVFETRAFDEVAGMIERCAASMESDEAQAWHDELERLRGQPGRLPFESGLPAGLAESIAPSRETLKRLACPAASELEVARTVPRGLGFDHR